MNVLAEVRDAGVPVVVPCICTRESPLNLKQLSVGIKASQGWDVLQVAVNELGMLMSILLFDTIGLPGTSAVYN